jgi:phosphatidylglycerophosphate synthase
MISVETLRENKTLGFLGPYEMRIKQKLAQKMPNYIKSYQLTLSTILWASGAIFFAVLSQSNIHYVWGMSVMILLHYVTDLVDGEVGRLTNDGLPRWAFFMDHFLDYIFLCTLIISYGFIIPSGFDLTFFIFFAIFSSIAVNMFLDFGVTNKFKIAYLGIGPTEIQLFFIGINTAVIFFGTNFLGKILPLIITMSFLFLCFMFYKTHKKLWRT